MGQENVYFGTEPLNAGTRILENQGAAPEPPADPEGSISQHEFRGRPR